jgi:hypothetical protein
MSEIEREDLPDPIREAFNTLAAAGKANMSHTKFVGKATVNIFHPSKLIEGEGFWERTQFSVDPELIDYEADELVELEVFEEE